MKKLTLLQGLVYLTISVNAQEIFNATYKKIFRNFASDALIHCALASANDQTTILRRLCAHQKN